MGARRPATSTTSANASARRPTSSARSSRRRRRRRAAPPQQITFHKDDARPPGPHQRQRRVDRLRVRRRPVGRTPSRTASAASWPSRSTPTTRPTPRRSRPSRQDATEFALSHDEKYVAFVVHGELFLHAAQRRQGQAAHRQPGLRPRRRLGARRARRSSSSPTATATRTSTLLEPDDPEHPELVKAHRFKVKQLTNTPRGGDRRQLRARRQARRLPPRRQAVDDEPRRHRREGRSSSDGQVFDYDWSPDGKWLVYARSDGSFASELYIIPATGATAEDPARNVTRFATFNGGVTWSKTATSWPSSASAARAPTSAYVLSLQKPAVAGAPASKDIDWDDIHLRVKQPAPMTDRANAPSPPTAPSIAFRGNQDGDDLWVASADGGQVTRLTTGNMQADADPLVARSSAARSTSATATATSADRQRRRPGRRRRRRRHPLPGAR